jgi:hypothetical protein
VFPDDVFELRVWNNMNTQRRHWSNCSGGQLWRHCASDRGNDTPERFRSFIEKRHIALPLAFDVGGKAHDSFGLRGVPALVVLDRNGKVRLTRTGYNAAETTFRRDLVQFLKTL